MKRIFIASLVCLSACSGQKITPEQIVMAVNEDRANLSTLSQAAVGILRRLEAVEKKLGIKVEVKKVDANPTATPETPKP